MGITPFYVGQSQPVWVITVTDDTGAAVNLTGVSGSAFSLSIINTQTQLARAGAGAFIITDAVNGKVQYAWSPQDSAIPGQYKLQVTFTINGGPEVGDPIDWTVKIPGT